MRDDRVIGHQLKPPLLRDGGHQQHQLHPRERLADALTRTAAEREVREARQPRLELGCPSIGIKVLRVGVVPRIAVHDPLAHYDDGARWHVVAVDAVLVDGAAPDEPGRRIQAHRLGDDAGRIRKPLDVGDRRQTPGQHCGNLVVETTFDVGRLTEEVPRPRQGVCRGLVARQKDRHRLVADLAVSHPPPFVLVVLREQERREQVAPVGAAGAPLANNPVDDSVEPLACMAAAPQVGDWQPF